jgi:hypothetical protein
VPSEAALDELDALIAGSEDTEIGKPNPVAQAIREQAKERVCARHPRSAARGMTASMRALGRKLQMPWQLRSLLRPAVAPRQRRDLLLGPTR